MMTTEQVNHWFTYHKPTAETAPKYAAIREAEASAARVAVAMLNAQTLPTYDDVNRECRAFAEAIDANAPDSADKTAAIRCVRLARMALNEALTFSASEEWMSPSETVITLCREAERELRRARWQANSAIACGGR